MQYVYVIQNVFGDLFNHFIYLASFIMILLNNLGRH
jgi:hypothetical protein